jgi:hypothetical protein
MWLSSYLLKFNPQNLQLKPATMLSCSDPSIYFQAFGISKDINPGRIFTPSWSQRRSRGTLAGNICGGCPEFLVVAHYDGCKPQV